MKARAVRLHTPGGPEQMKLEDVELEAPGPGQVLLRQTAIGVNFIDVYHRTGLYPLPLPSGLGQEGAGVVEAVGPGVTEIEVGDRVAYAGQLGAYATHRLAQAERLVRLPPGIDDQIAAASMLKGMTARYLLRAVTHVSPGHTIVIHAAAGGTGQLLVQWAIHLGAIVIAVVGSEPKAQLVRALGAQHVVVRSKESFKDTALAVTGGKGVDVVYDSVGRDTFSASLECLRARGLMVSFGQSSGLVPAFELSALQKRCLYLTRPSLHVYTELRTDLVDSASDLFEVLEKGALKVTISRTFPLADVGRAHELLEARATTGSLLLLPS